MLDDLVISALFVTVEGLPEPSSMCGHFWSHYATHYVLDAHGIVAESVLIHLHGFRFATT